MSSWSMWVNRSFDKECYIPELLWMGMRHGINLASLACASQSSLILPSLHNPSLGKDELNQHHLLRAEDNSGYDGLDRVGLRHVSLLAPGILHQFLWVRFLSGCVRFGLRLWLRFKTDSMFQSLRREMLAMFGMGRGGRWRRPAPPGAPARRLWLATMRMARQVLGGVFPSLRA